MQSEHKVSNVDSNEDPLTLKLLELLKSTKKQLTNSTIVSNNNNPNDDLLNILITLETQIINDNYNMHNYVYQIDNSQVQNSYSYIFINYTTY